MGSGPLPHFFARGCAHEPSPEGLDRVAHEGPEVGAPAEGLGMLDDEAGTRAGIPDSVELFHRHEDRPESQGAHGAHEPDVSPAGRTARVDDGHGGQGTHSRLGKESSKGRMGDWIYGPPLRRKMGGGGLPSCLHRGHFSPIE
jgi:hypothetical protein